MSGECEILNALNRSLNEEVMIKLPRLCKTISNWDSLRELENWNWFGSYFS